MAEKEYPRANDELKNHTQCKLDILREYFAQYLWVKSFHKSPRFRIAIVDGFAGSGIYKNGIGSPLIFLQELEKFSRENNIWRGVQKLPELSIECLFIVNDIDPEANESLHNQLKIWEQNNDIPKERLNVEIQKLQKPFLDAYKEIKPYILARGFKNVLFNIDPCGYTQVNLTTLYDIMNSFKNVEIFYTFMIGALFQYASWENRDATEKSIKKILGVPIENFLKDETLWRKSEWLGEAEKIIHAQFSKIANFVSPFAINQQGGVGYNYWLLHFSNHYRAREVYNNVLHENSSGAAHVGSPGFNMLECTPDEKRFFDFSEIARNDSRQELDYDIPKLISEFEREISVDEFRNAIYNDTPAHADDINNALIENHDTEVITDKGVPRRSAKTIKKNDIIRLKKQPGFYFFTPPNNKNKK